MKKLALLGLVVALTACGGEPVEEVAADEVKVESNEVAVDKASFEGKWALAVESGVIGCDNQAIYMKADDGNTYALNGTAQTRSKAQGLGWLPVDRDSKVWLDDPDNTGAKMNVGDMIQAGLAVCE